jgi:hypothetical protein
MSLIRTIEELDPGHFARREDILENLRTKLSAMGFFPLPLSLNDIECFWVTLQPNDSHKGCKIHVTEEELYWDNFIEVVKEVARYGGTN